MSIITQSIPSVFTLANLFMGMLSMINAMEGTEAGFTRAAWFIVAAAIFDTLDGKASRVLNTASKFGVELDSIVDACSFGIAPALLAYQYILTYLPAWSAFAFPVAFVYAACVTLRLARFNVQLVGFSKTSFTGMPSPMGAGLVATFVAFANTDLMANIAAEHVFPYIVIIAAALMVSSVKYDTMPKLSWSGGYNRFKLVTLLTAIGLAVFFPAEVFFPTGVLYMS
ncbi:MAG TPA: CDP-diacylglycerol--serine O-phosphatidyltransferase, partial [Firmicutes bacterium]|nr:CDP-diacylglycerol--serine O-phosphatidyltransferase [Bacillota bacterium]